MKSDAVISPCGRYRYLLTRRWDDDPKAKRCLFIMLNPSTADATEDDPTIKRCIGFAKREGAGELRVANLYAYRATEPADLFLAAKRGEDVIGIDNGSRLSSEVFLADLIICGWGNHGKRGEAWRRAVYQLDQHRKPGFALAETKSGQPWHPLYVKSGAPLIPWHVPRGAEAPTPVAREGKA